MTPAVAGPLAAAPPRSGRGALDVPAEEAQWIEVRSPHFIVDTNAGASRGRDVAAHFEQVRAVFQAAFPKSRVDPAEPLTILAVRNEQDLSRLLPQFWRSKSEEHPAGFFVTDREKSYVALRVDADSAGEQYHVLYHEYVHLLESLNFKSLPLWASEGLAEFYGSLQTEGDLVGIGYPLPSHVRELQTAKKLPLAALLTTDESSPYYNEAKLTSIFYAQSWELTDYLLTAGKGGYAKSFWNYVVLVSKGAGSLDAARQSFGDLDRLAAAVDAFERQGNFPYYQIKAPFPDALREFSLRPLSPAESAAVRGDFMLYAGQQDEAQAMLNQAIALDPRLAAPYASLGLMEVRSNDRAKALPWLDRAARLGSGNYLVYYYRAMLSLGASNGAEVPDQARADLAKCISLNPGFAEGYRALAQVDASRGQDLDNALRLARRAVELDPGQPQDYLTIGLVLVHLNRAGEAAVVARHALALARTPEDRQNAQQFLEEVAQIQSEQNHQTAAGNSIPEPAPEQAMPAPETTRQQSYGASEAPGAAMAEGTAKGVKCAGMQMSFRLITGMGPVDLHAADYTKLRYTSSEALSSGFIPCTMLEGRQIAVRYQPPSGRAKAGELAEIDLQK